MSLAVALDIKGAVSNARWPMIVRALNERHVPTSLKTLICSYLSQASVLVLAGVGKDNSGVQGMPSGVSTQPLYVAFGIGLAPVGAATTWCQGVAYADDIMLIGSGREVDAVAEGVNEALAVVIAWASFYSVTNIQLHKCSYLLFTNPNYPTPLLCLGINSIPRVQELTYLGVVFNDKLTWTVHIKYICSKVMKFLHQIRRVAWNNWGASGKAVNVFISG